MSSDNTDRIVRELQAALDSWNPTDSLALPHLPVDRLEAMLRSLEALIGLPRSQWTM